MRQMYELFELIQTINLMSAQATQTCMMMKLPTKHYEMHTTIKLHGETIPIKILAGLLLDLVSPSKFDKIHQCRTLKNFGAYRLSFSSSIHQLVGLGGLFCQLNVTEQESLVTTI